jgi:hypothetical protein
MPILFRLEESSLFVRKFVCYIAGLRTDFILVALGGYIKDGTSHGILKSSWRKVLPGTDF